jgi:hypothetical protein
MCSEEELVAAIAVMDVFNSQSAWDNRRLKRNIKERINGGLFCSCSFGNTQGGKW